MAGGGILSGGIVFAIAAVLWLVYLIPTWVRRHEYMSAERNSVRLQQTLRILAETSEMPDEVRFEATAREVAAQQKRLKRIEAERAAARKAESRAAVETARAESQATALRARADARAAAARARAQAAEATERAAAEQARARAKTRLMRSRRRARLATTLFAAASGVTASVTGITAVSTGAWALPAISAGGVVASIALLGRMATVGSRVTRTVTVPQMARPVEREIFDADLTAEEKATVERTWTPTSLPKPLHLSQGSVAAATLAAEASRTRLREAAIAEAMAQKANGRQPQAASIDERRAARDEQRSVQQPAEASPYASMGIVDEGEILAADLLRRRMAAG
ncbi:large exoprotein [Paramicrobacterium fandaimingii]|uniref:large exoprotein n=1 Tax=Paramicrobacterium fandaimingii TaxID=2708079 RepID=UPI00141F3F07|nr:large exoprotein [Microbacterium fandaimingii]